MNETDRGHESKNILGGARGKSGHAEQYSDTFRTTIKETTSDFNKTGPGYFGKGQLSVDAHNNQTSKDKIVAEYTPRNPGRRNDLAGVGFRAGTYVLPEELNSSRNPTGHQVTSNAPPSRSTIG